MMGAVSCSAPAQSKLNNWADYMETHEADVVATAVAGDLPVTFYWPNTEFNGHHICDTGTSGINDLVSAPTGPGDFSCPGSPLPCASMESYHPNNTGTPLYATAFLNALKAANSDRPHSSWGREQARHAAPGPTTINYRRNRRGA